MYILPQFKNQQKIFKSLIIAPLMTEMDFLSAENESQVESQIYWIYNK
jgi:hypothetical protein